MLHGVNFSLFLAVALICAGAARAGEPARGHEGGARPAAHPAEPHPGPKGYQRVTEPRGWNERPATVDRSNYQHNFQAARSYRIGPYHRPAGWRAHHWGYGEILPRAYWAPQYLLSDYWLFALEVPPAGYEWVRDGDDALLINTDSGEILQVEYGVFG
jgi:Ni/Co efflux regulator RcnB